MYASKSKGLPKYDFLVMHWLSLYLVLGLFSLPAAAANCVISGLCKPTVEIDHKQLAFPSAQGYGAYARGGRGGKVVFVTNLNDNGEGSLRWALEVLSEPRIVVFKIAGVINLRKNIVIRHPFLTLAGQSAPGNGVCLKGSGIVIKTNDVVIRYMCIRPGDGVGAEGRVRDGIAFDRASNSIVDHVSVSWTFDETMQVWYPQTVDNTVQYSIFSEPLNASKLRPDEGHPHGYGPLIGDGGKRFSFHHNVIAFSLRRNPRISNFKDADIVNNIIYKFGTVGTQIYDSGAKQSSTGINIINNFYHFQGTTPAIHVLKIKAKSSIFIAGNKRFPNMELNSVFKDVDSSEAIAVSMIRKVFNIQLQSALELWETLLDGVGASKPEIDAVDLQLFADLRNGSGDIIDCVDRESLASSVLVKEDCVIESAYGSWPVYSFTDNIVDKDVDVSMTNGSCNTV